MTTENRQEIEMLMRQAIAAQTVNEMILMHLFVRIAGITDQPGEFVRLIMMNIEDNLRKAVRTIPETEGSTLEKAEDALTYFNDISGRMIAMITPKQTSN